MNGNRMEKVLSHRQVLHFAPMDGPIQSFTPFL